MKTHWEIVNSGKVVASNSPETLWKQATSYFKWCDEHPIVITRTITSGKRAGEKLEDEKCRPYSIKALCIHCGILQTYLQDIVSTNDETSEYYRVVQMMLYIIYVQNLEMATIGEYSPVFTSKLLNIDRDDTPQRPVTVTIVDGLPRLAKSENEILEMIKEENAKEEGSIEEFT